MPTAKPRITLTLTDQQHAVLSKLAKAQKVSMSSIVVDLVDTTLPVLERLSTVLVNAANAPKALLDDLKRTAEQVESDVAGSHGTVMDQLDLLVSASGAGAVRDAQAARAVTAPRPPTSNRGVRITSPRSKIGPISPMKKGEKNGRAEK